MNIPNRLNGISAGEVLSRACILQQSGKPVEALNFLQDSLCSVNTLSGTQLIRDCIKSLGAEARAAQGRAQVTMARKALPSMAK